MANILMLVACMLIGAVLRATGRVPENAHLTLFGFIIHVALPAVILVQIHGIRLRPDLLLPVSMPWLLFGLSASVFILLGRLLRLPAVVVGALTMTAGLGNTSFIGLPMIETFYGAENLPEGILIDQLGTYLVLGTLGIVTASLFASTTASWRGVIWRVATFPPLLALLLALALSPVTYPAWLDATLHRLGDTLAPLALVSVGLQISFDQVRANRLAVGLGLGFKLVVAPLVVALLYIGLFEGHDDVSRVTVFEAAMGPQIGGAIVAMQCGLSQPVTTLMVTIGIALSFLTLPLWFAGLSFV